jgi:hypothetical protein
VVSAAPRVLGGKARQLGARLVEVSFGARGAGPQVVTGLGQRRGPPRNSPTHTCSYEAADRMMVRCEDRGF